MTELALVGAGALLAGLAVGFIEETFFRGALYGGMRRAPVDSGRPHCSARCCSRPCTSSDRRPSPPDEAIGWRSGFSLLFGAFDAYAGPAMWDSFVALAAVRYPARPGARLARQHRRRRRRARRLGAGHQDRQEPDPQDVPDSPLAFLIGTYDHVVGWLVTGWLVAADRGDLAAGHEQRKAVESQQV